MGRRWFRGCVWYLSVCQVIFGDSSGAGEGLRSAESGTTDLCGGFGDHSLSSVESLFKWFY